MIHDMGFRRAVALLFLICAAAATVFGQYDTGSINGTVRDTTGAVIPDATVTVVNMGTNRTYITKTSSVGEFVASPLPVGNYSVKAAKTGFEEITISNIPVHISVTSRADVTLKVGSQVQTVTVTASQVAVNTATADVGTTLGKNDLTEIPSGRTWETALAVLPYAGVNTFEAGISVLIDGADSNTSMENGMGLQADRSNMVITRENLDSISEIQVMQGNYSAEFGRSMGDVVNLVTKGGSNQFHGEGFEFYRNADLGSARNFFATGPSVPMTWNQFGGNFGGPILKNKLFVFVDYEGIRNTSTASGQASVLNATQRELVVPVLQPVVAAVPLPNGPNVPNGSAPAVYGYYNYNLQNSHSENTGSARVDWNISSRDVFTGRYNINDSGTNLVYGVAEGQSTQTPQRIQFIKVSETHTFSPTLINQAGFATQQNFAYAYGGGGNFSTTIFGCTGCSLPSLPGPALFQQYLVYPTYEALDTVTKSTGRHTIKFGADIRRNEQNQRTDLQETLSFTSLANFEQNNPWELGSVYTPLILYRNTNYAFFVNDNYRILPRLTLDLGLRWEHTSVVHDLGNKLQNFDIATQSLVPAGSQFYKPIYTDFGPRIGLAWDPFGRGKTVAHAGFGIFYDPQGNLSSSVAENTVHDLSYNIYQAPLNCSPALVLAYPLPDPLPTCTPVPAFSVTEVDPHMRDMYEEHWNVGVQQEIAKNIILDTSYVASQTVHMGADLTNGPNFNPLNPYTGARPLGDTEFLDETLNGSYYNAHFNSLAVKLKGQLSQVTFNVALTWQNEMDNMTGFFGAYQDPYDPQADWERSSRGVQANGNVVYHFHDVPRLPKVIGRGWEVSALEQHSPGSPFTITTGKNTIWSTSQRPDRVLGVSEYPQNKTVFNQLNRAAFATPAGPQGSPGNLGVNSVIGPATQWLDMSVMKNTSIRDKATLILRCDFFNVLNHPTFGNADGNLNDGTFGTVTSTSGGARTLQVSAKVTF